MLYVNHSCEPNTGFGGNVVVVAMRDIEKNEELTIDYAMFEDSPDFSLECTCNKPNCRHRISGNDWTLSELQFKYKGYFTWYINQKINNNTKE